MLEARLAAAVNAAARTQLRGARDRFAAMDLTLWVQRATAEKKEEPLTSQETNASPSAGA